MQMGTKRKRKKKMEMIMMMMMMMMMMKMMKKKKKKKKEEKVTRERERGEVGCTTGSLDGNVDGGTAAECSRVLVGLPAVHLPESRLSAAGSVGGRGRGRARTEGGVKTGRR